MDRTLIGHDRQVEEFKAAFTGNRPHHAWLLTGAQGLGKAHFAKAAAAWVLAGRPSVTGFEINPDSQASKLLAAGSHLDFKLIERLTSRKGDKLKKEIIVQQLIRRDDRSWDSDFDKPVPLRDTLVGTPALSDYRVVIVDAAEDMNKNVANALLKNLEEPTAGTIFFLICHSPGRLLPTIRSRCRTLRFNRLADSQVALFLERSAPELDDADRATLVRIAEGAPGRALRFAEDGIALLEEQLVELSKTPPEAAPAKAMALARTLAGKTNGARYAAFLELAPAMIADAARHRRGPALARALADWEAASTLAAGAVPLSLDPQAVAFDIAGKVAALARQ
jgi:DNA polymerase-3 subunit delta'